RRPCGAGRNAAACLAVRSLRRMAGAAVFRLLAVRRVAPTTGRRVIRATLPFETEAVLPGRASVCQRLPRAFGKQCESATSTAAAPRPAQATPFQRVLKSVYRLFRQTRA